MHALLINHLYACAVVHLHVYCSMCVSLFKRLNASLLLYESSSITCGGWSSLYISSSYQDGVVVVSCFGLVVGLVAGVVMVVDVVLGSPV